MTLLRARLATVALLAAVLTATAAPLLAASPRPVCAMKRHDCGHRAGAARRCCVTDGGSSSQNGPVEARVQLRIDQTSTPVTYAADALPAPAGRSSRVQTFPPGATPPDLVTLFSTLLI